MQQRVRTEIPPRPVLGPALSVLRLPAGAAPSAATTAVALSDVPLTLELLTLELLNLPLTLGVLLGDSTAVYMNM